MGELALRKLQSGVETGTLSAFVAAVAATRRVYGVLEPHRDQPRRMASEDRGILVSDFRANARVVDASFKFKADLLFEDLPYFLEMMNKGGVTATGSATVGYSYDYSPDLTSDTLKTRTLEWGDESLDWQGPFATADQLKISFGNPDEPVEMELDGFVQEWWPRGRGGFAGFTGAIGEHTVESVMGWQTRLFIDTSPTAIGTTAVPGRLVKMSADYKNNNKRKYFGDMGPFYTKVGRGKRNGSLSFEVEEEAAAVYAGGVLNELAYIMDTNIAGQLPKLLRIRIQFAGSPITGTTFGTTNQTLVAGTAYTSITTNALTSAIPGGAVIALGAGGPLVTVTPAGAIATATTIPIFSYLAKSNLATTQTIMRARSIELDFYGVLKGDPKWGAHDTNVTFALELDDVYEAAAGKAEGFTVTNGNSAATP